MEVSVAGLFSTSDTEYGATSGERSDNLTCFPELSDDVRSFALSLSSLSWLVLMCEYTDDSSVPREDFGGDDPLLICDEVFDELLSCTEIEDFVSDFSSDSRKDDALEEVVRWLDLDDDLTSIED